MQIRVTSSDPGRASADVLALPLFELDPKKWKLPARLARLDRELEGRLGQVLATGDFRGKAGETLWVYAGSGIQAPRVLLVGLGAERSADAEAVRRFAGSAVGAAASRCARLALVAPASRRLGPALVGRAAAEGALLAGYRFDRYREKRDDDPRVVSEVTLLFERAPDARAARRAAETGVVVAESQNVARDLSNEPPNELTPDHLARFCQKVAKEVGLRARVLGVPELRKRKMGGILAVGGGSAHPPRMIVLEHGQPRGGAGKGRSRGRGRPTVCLVGKGITFDTGGISIKPAQSMEDMKHDMSGAATVVGALRAAALLKLPVNLVGVIGSAENMPSGTAYRPGDVVRTAAGKHVEVVNTDAEGRVVLADALHLAVTDYQPDAVVDLATLTGACVIALGGWCSGLFGNDEGLVERLRSAGEAAAERAWPMPLWDEHRKHIRSRVGDIKNAGGREAGAATAAAFLSHFVGDVPWAHLDIAGTAWTDKASPYQPPGATGVGVRLLLEALQGWRKG